MRAKLSTIPEAVEDIKKGKLVIVVDHATRENEGDFITSAENVTPEIVNFMARHGRGLICVAVTSQRCKELKLEDMVSKNTSLHKTAFTVSVDLLGHGATTGISAHDRAKTIQALASPNTKPEDLGRPGHIFPLKAEEGGVVARAGHTEAAVELSRLANFSPVGALVEILNEDGTMARLPNLVKLAKKFKLKIISIDDLTVYLRAKRTVKKEIRVKLPTKWGSFHLFAFRQADTGQEHMALVKGKWESAEPILVRIHSSCITGDIFGSLRCDCGQQFEKAVKLIETAGKGVIVYLNQEGRGIGLLNKLKAYKLQEEGKDTVEANHELGFPADARDYRAAAEILQDLGALNIKLLSNNPAKIRELKNFGIRIVKRVSLEIPPNHVNGSYLQTKKKKLGHHLKFV